MKTEVTMKRELFGFNISQKSKSEFFSLTDLVKAGNKWRSTNGMEQFNHTTWLKNKGTKEFIRELEEKYGQVKINSRGKNSHTWVHPLLFIDLALAISPKLKIEVYEWLFDCLLKNRNDSGDSYKKMCGALYVRTKNKSMFHVNITTLALKIQKECGVTEWQGATIEQLKHRDTIHNNIALLANVLDNNKEAIRLGIYQARD